VVAVRDYLASLWGRGAGDYTHDAELFLHDIEQVVIRRFTRGEEDVIRGDGGDNNDDDNRPSETELELTLSGSPMLIVAYQPQLTQPPWERVERDGHLKTLDLQDRLVVNNTGDGVNDRGGGIAWLTTVYYYFALSLFGVLVLAYSFVFTSITINRIS
jgi:hypothetical protein